MDPAWSRFLAEVIILCALLISIVIVLAIFDLFGCRKRLRRIRTN